MLWFWGESDSRLCRSIFSELACMFSGFVSLLLMVVFVFFSSYDIIWLFLIKSTIKLSHNRHFDANNQSNSQSERLMSARQNDKNVIESNGKWYRGKKKNCRGCKDEARNIKTFVFVIQSSKVAPERALFLVLLDGCRIFMYARCHQAKQLH